ncbi:MAG: hypothetical protein JSV94_00790 [Methanobacteriota archaeon]|nr:MAG: hypothetical protein JSV94_00790 [Euryarchaeota archaeon]
MGTDSDDSGQITLMDAMVFFAIMLIICSIQLSALSRDMWSDDQLIEPTGRGDPSSVLSVLMRASIGVGSSIRIDGGLSVPPDTLVSECLAVEAASLVGGIAETAFCVLNGVIISIMTNLTHPLTKPHLILNRHTEDGMFVLLRLENDLLESVDVTAADCDLPSCAEDRITVSLLLEPALLPESRDV